jgi:plastocyanin
MTGSNHGQVGFKSSKSRRNSPASIPPKTARNRTLALGTNRSFVPLIFYMKRITIPKYLSCAFLLAGAVYCFGRLSSARADVTVEIINYAFSPNTVDVAVNDTVNWVWQGDYHSTTSDDYLWDSGFYNTGYTYSYTFTSVGSFPYYCVVHGFTGTVNVQETAPPPPIEVDIIDFAFSPDDITINVDDTVQWVWQTDDHSTTSDDSLWDSGIYDTGYIFNYTFTSAGSFPYYCVVHGFTGTVNVISSVPISLNPPQRTATSFQFSYSAAVGLTYVVDRAVVFPDWTPISTNTAATSVVLFQDNSAPASGAFYRVRQMRNP